MKLFSRFVVLILVLLTARSGVSQNEIPVKISLLGEQISLPVFPAYSHHYGYGFNIGSEFKYAEKKKIDLVQTADFYFLDHQKYGSSLLVASQFDFRFKPGKLNIDLKLGPGYMLFHHYTSIYKEVNGTYEKKSNLQGKFAGLFSIAVSYPIQTFKPFIAYDLLAETPFINSSSGFLPHQILEAGFYYTIKLKKDEN
jgi:hypothetical protein